MPFMALRHAGHASRTRAHVVRSTGAWASRARRSRPAKAWTSRAQLSRRLSLSLFLPLFSAAVESHHGEPENKHLSSIPRARVSTFTSPLQLTPPCLDYGQAELQFLELCPPPCRYEPSPPASWPAFTTLPCANSSAPLSRLDSLSTMRMPVGALPPLRCH